MATTSTPQRPPPQADQQEVRIYSHTMLLYWWPVWVCCFVMSLWTYLDGHRLAILPPNATVKNRGNSIYELNTQGGTSQVLDEALKRSEQLEQGNKTGGAAFPIHVAQNSRLGPIFVVVLLLVVVITNVPLRGLWSVVVIVTVVLTTVIISLIGGAWDEIFRTLGNLHIFINLAGYFFIGVGLLVMWLASVFFFDRQTYMVFTPGQLRVCQEIGSGETSIDSQGLQIEKHRNDLFRHWILGLGSGDLTISTSGARPQHFEMHNVLFIGAKLRAIEDMKTERPTVQGKG